MLKDKNSSAILAVKNLERSRSFYENILGLSPEKEMAGKTVVYTTGSTRLLIYESFFAGTNKANAVVWGVGDEVDSITQNLQSKGVRFEHYDLPNTKLQGDVHVSGNMRLVWFQDPDGNILHINNI